MGGGYTQGPPLGQKRRSAGMARTLGVMMPRPLLILIVLVVVVLGVLFALGSMDREVPQVRVERPLTNAAGQ